MVSVTILLRASGSMLLALFGVVGLRWAEAAFVDNSGNLGTELSEEESLEAWEEEMKDEVEHMPTKKLIVHSKDVVFAEEALNAPIVGKPIIVKERKPVISAREGVKKTLHQTAANQKDALVSGKTVSKKKRVKKQGHATTEKNRHTIKSMHSASHKKGDTAATVGENSSSEVDSTKRGSVGMVATQFAAAQNTAEADELVGGISDQSAAEESSSNAADDDEMLEDDEAVDATSKGASEAQTKGSSESADIKTQGRRDEDYSDTRVPTADDQSEGPQNATPTDEERLEMDQVPLNREQSNATVPEQHNDTLPLPRLLRLHPLPQPPVAGAIQETRETELDYHTEDEYNDYADHSVSKRASDYHNAAAKASRTPLRLVKSPMYSKNSEYGVSEEGFKNTRFEPDYSRAANIVSRSQSDVTRDDHHEDFGKRAATWPSVKRIPVQQTADYSLSMRAVPHQRPLQARQDYSWERRQPERMGEATYEANSDYEDRGHFEASLLMMAAHEYSDHGAKLLDESSTAADEVDEDTQDGDEQSVEEFSGEEDAPEKGWSGEDKPKQIAPVSKTTAKMSAAATGDRPALAQTGETSVEQKVADSEDTNDEVTDDDAEDEDEKSSADETKNDDEITATTQGDIDVEEE